MWSERPKHFKALYSSNLFYSKKENLHIHLQKNSNPLYSESLTLLQTQFYEPDNGLTASEISLLAPDHDSCGNLENDKCIQC